MNKQVRLARRPVGMPVAEDFALTEEPVPEPGEGELLVKIRFISLDPAMRGWMSDAKSYIAPIAIGDVVRAAAVGEVVASRHAEYAVGDCVVGMLGVQEHALSDGRGLITADADRVPMPTLLGGLGGTGLTAYFGLMEIGQPKPGETVLVSGAAGAVGSVVGQLAKLHGCRVVGIAGGPEKCAHLTDTLGFDGAVDYKAGGVRDAIRAACPGGVDVYFDNVGGPILDDALANISRGARVVICGAISQYNNTSAWTGPRNYIQLLIKRARMEGFVLFDFHSRYAEGTAYLARLLGRGELHLESTIATGGVHAFPQALARLFSGDKRGKLVLSTER